MEKYIAEIFVLKFDMKCAVISEFNFASTTLERKRTRLAKILYRHLEEFLILRQNIIPLNNKFIVS